MRSVLYRIYGINTCFWQGGFRALPMSGGRRRIRQMAWTARLVSSLALCVSLGMSAASADDKTQFEHVMNIGSTGTGEGQFKYVEDFAFSKDGHLLVTDAVHAWVQVFDKTSGKFISRF